MEKDGLLEEYYSFMENPESIPSDAYAQSLVGRVIKKYGSIEKAQELINIEKKKRTSLENKFKFIKTADEMKLNPEEVLENRVEKEKLIRKYGYPQLDVHFNESGGDFLSNYSNDKIGELFKKTYYSVKEQLSK